jgi:hypothetical protein
MRTIHLTASVAAALAVAAPAAQAAKPGWSGAVDVAPKAAVAGAAVGTVANTGIALVESGTTFNLQARRVVNGTPTGPLRPFGPRPKNGYAGEALLDADAAGNAVVAAAEDRGNGTPSTLVVRRFSVTLDRFVDRWNSESTLANPSAIALDEAPDGSILVGWLTQDAPTRVLTRAFAPGHGWGPITDISAKVPAGDRPLGIAVAAGNAGRGWLVVTAQTGAIGPFHAWAFRRRSGGALDLAKNAGGDGTLVLAAGARNGAAFCVVTSQTGRLWATLLHSDGSLGAPLDLTNGRPGLETSASFRVLAVSPLGSAAVAFRLEGGTPQAQDVVRRFVRGGWRPLDALTGKDDSAISPPVVSTGNGGRAIAGYERRSDFHFVTRTFGPHGQVKDLGGSDLGALAATRDGHGVAVYPRGVRARIRSYAP